MTSATADGEKVEADAPFWMLNQTATVAGDRTDGRVYVRRTRDEAAILDFSVASDEIRRVH